MIPEPQTLPPARTKCIEGFLRQCLAGLCDAVVGVQLSAAGHIVRQPQASAATVLPARRELVGGVDFATQVLAQPPLSLSGFVGRHVKVRS